MSAKILTFPKLKKELETTYRVSLYTDQEVETVIICVNVFSLEEIKYNIDNVSTIDPLLIVQCLNAAVDSNIFGPEIQSTAKQILNNVEKIDFIK